MQTLGAFDAKTRLSELLARAEKGESFIITKHGRPVARLVPETVQDADEIAAAVENLKSFRGLLSSSSQEELREDRHRGHRF